MKELLSPSTAMGNALKSGKLNALIAIAEAERMDPFESKYALGLDVDNVFKADPADKDGYDRFILCVIYMHDTPGVSKDVFRKTTSHSGFELWDGGISLWVMEPFDVGAIEPEAFRHSCRALMAKNMAHLENWKANPPEMPERFKEALAEQEREEALGA